MAERCETCGSDDPARMVSPSEVPGYPWHCPDSFHDSPDQEARAELADGSLIEPGVAWQTITKLRAERDELRQDNADLLNDAVQDGQYVKRLRAERDRLRKQVAEHVEWCEQRGASWPSADLRAAADHARQILEAGE